MLSNSCIVTLIVIFVNYLQISQACNGYTLKVNKIQECIPNSILKIENGDAVLDKDCNVMLKGCVIVTKTFKESKGKWRIEKAPLPPIEGASDFCTATAEQRLPQMEDTAKMYNVTLGCPFTAKKVCGSPDKKISIKKYKNMLGTAAGTIKGHLEAVYDVGRACLDVVVTVSKIRR